MMAFFAGELFLMAHRVEGQALRACRKITFTI